MNFEDFKNSEFQEKLRGAKSPQELLALAKEAGMELSDEQLEAVSGGVTWDCFDIRGCMDVDPEWDRMVENCKSY